MDKDVALAVVLEDRVDLDFVLVVALEAKLVKLEMGELEMDDVKLKIMVAEDSGAVVDVDCHAALESLDRVEVELSSPAPASTPPVVPLFFFLLTSTPMTTPAPARANRIRIHQAAFFLHFLELAFSPEVPIK